MTSHMLNENSNKCIICNLSTPYRSNENISFVMCDQCQTNHALYNKTFCINELLLDKNDIDQIRYFYKGNTKLFLENDIKILIEHKYGTYDEYKNYKEQKLLQKYKKINNITEKRQNRKLLLIRELSENKLDLKMHGDCYTYIQFGYPELDIVIKNELEKSKEYFIRYNESFNYKNTSHKDEDEYSISSIINY